ncbi:hypothetical protein FGG08_004792 [Glutinoglossum americanum]|uniref:Uncharacterized protein n=1 Tax=Glutinoglossum americanum TaxID=1670608 RepID=A0A9P8I504_9PEZI|nr:hypothetical protein FGG08_004792 [Glutinoglossum americanum]
MRDFKKSGMVPGVRAKEASEAYDAAMILLRMAGAPMTVEPQTSPRTEAAWILMSLVAADKAVPRRRKTESARAARALLELSTSPRVFSQSGAGRGGCAAAVPALALPGHHERAALARRRGVSTVAGPATVVHLPHAVTGAGVSKASGSRPRCDATGKFLSTHMDAIAAAATDSADPSRAGPVDAPAAAQPAQPARSAQARPDFIPIHTRPLIVPASVTRGSAGGFHFYSRAEPDQERFIVLEREKGTSMKDIARAMFPDDDDAAHKKHRSWVGNRWLGYVQAWYHSCRSDPAGTSA